MGGCGRDVVLLKPQKEQFITYQVTLDDLVKVIFHQNKMNAQLLIGLDSTSMPNKMLFLLLVDIMVKGFILLYGEGNKLDLSLLSSDNFEFIAFKMSLAGFKVRLRKIPCEFVNDECLNDDPHSPVNRHLFINKHVQLLHTQKEDLPLDEYKFVIIVHDDVYSISYTAESLTTRRLKPLLLM